MELALYCPVCGYYEKEKDNVGRRGDFITSISIGRVFGELLAFQFSEWLKVAEENSGVCQLVEAGAHDGRLALDMLAWWREWRPVQFEKLEYHVVEPSALLQSRQKKMLGEFSEKIRWSATLNELETKSGGAGVCGIIFSNELLDAMPVHRIGWDAGNKSWFEWGVTLEREQFVWIRMPASEIDGAVPKLAPEILGILPDDFTTEISPRAVEWWRSAAKLLRKGKLLTVDYGLTTEEFFSPERSRGTLRTYSRHHAANDLLVTPGEHDITAHVDFSAILAAGESAGLKTESFLSQERFLTQIAGEIWKRPADFPEWAPTRLRQFKTLTHPDHFGRAFRVLVQSR